MNFYDFDLYKPSRIELWISERYQNHGIYSPADMDLDRIGSIFDTYIAYTEGETKVMYDDDNDCLIFLNIYLDIPERRAAFFHELCHPAMHTGNQHSLPDTFVDLQESQATQFQLYASMPAYMLEKFEPSQFPGNYLTMLAESFMLPLSFVQGRIEQIQRRIYREHQERNLRARTTPRPAIYSYTDETMRIMNQLHRQVAERKGNYHAGR